MGTPPIIGTAGDDDFDGTIGDDEFDMDQGGDDIVHGLEGNDLFSYGAAFDRHDRVVGGDGIDSLLLSGEYDVTFAKSTMRGVEQIAFDDGFDYQITLNDANVAAGDTLIINGSMLTGASDLTFNGGAETDGRFVVTGGTFSDTITTGAGDDVVSGGGGSDFIIMGAGADQIDGGLGDDTIVFFGDGTLDNHDRVEGGGIVASLDTVLLSGDYSAGLTIKHATLTNIEKIVVLDGESYVLDIRHLNVENTGGFTVDGNVLSSLDSLQVDATGLTDVQLNLIGGAGDDLFIGGEDYDSFRGLGGVDRMIGNGGPDTFYYFDVPDSTGKKYDTVVGFDARDDFFFDTFDDFATIHTTGVDTRVNGGALSTASFNTDLSAAIGADELGVAHAVLFHPDAGSLAGEWFLVIEGDGTAGYQANADIVVHLESPKHLGEFDITNFGNAG